MSGVSHYKFTALASTQKRATGGFLNASKRWERRKNSFFITRQLLLEGDGLAGSGWILLGRIRYLKNIFLSENQSELDHCKNGLLFFSRIYLHSFSHRLVDYYVPTPLK